MIEADVILQLAFIALLAVGAAAFIFSSDTRGVSSFRFCPGSPAEWVAFWFHTLEFILLCGIFAALHPAARHYPYWAAQTLAWAVGGSAVLVVLSAIAFWRFDRSLCGHALLLLLFLCICLFLFFPAVAASRA